MCRSGHIIRFYNIYFGKHIHCILTTFNVLICAAVVLSLSCTLPASAQKKVEGVGGFEFVAKPYASGEERQAQPDLWIHEIRFKTMRMIETEVTDPKTGTRRPEGFCYLVYNAVNREIESREDNSDTVPVNPYDKDPVPNLLVPKVTLVSTDNGVRRVVEDSLCALTWSDELLICCVRSSVAIVLRRDSG